MAGLPEAIAQPGLTAVGLHQGCEVVAGDQLRHMGPLQQGIEERRIDHLQIFQTQSPIGQEAGQVQAVLNEAVTLQ